MRHRCLPVLPWASGGHWAADDAAKAGAPSGDRSRETKTAPGWGRGREGLRKRLGEAGARSPCDPRRGLRRGRPLRSSGASGRRSGDQPAVSGSRGDLVRLVGLLRAGSDDEKSN